jgi:glycosyltransferase involved in cell wall biosynthesis
MRCQWFNYKYLKIDGYGRFGIRFVQALHRAGVEVKPWLIDMLDLPAELQRMVGLDYSLLSVFLMPPHHLKPIAGRAWNYTMYECTKLPDDWADQINNKVERVIVPSQWLVEVFEENGVTRPVHVVPGGISPDEFPIFSTYHEDRPFTFMCLGDRGSRKGFDVTWSAFYKAFGDSKDVRLLVKCRPESLNHIDLSNSDRRVSVWRDDVEQMADVYAQADCYVFPTKGEGYGMPPREAAACGLPVITTRWSGTADDIDCWAIPINTFKLEKSMLQSKGMWAYPDVEEVAAHMRWVYEHREEARAKGRAAAQWLREHATWDHAAQKLIELFGRHG